MVFIKLFLAWLWSFPFTPLVVALDGGGDFSFKKMKETRRYNYEVNKAHITGDWKWLNKNYGTPLPTEDK